MAGFPEQNYQSNQQPQNWQQNQPQNWQQGQQQDSFIQTNLLILQSVRQTLQAQEASERAAAEMQKQERQHIANVLQACWQLVERNEQQIQHILQQQKRQSVNNSNG